MRSSRAMLYGQLLSELISQLSDLEELRSQVEDAEQSRRTAAGSRLTHHASRRLRNREPGALSVGLRRSTPPSRNAGLLSPLEQDHYADSTLLNPSTNGWSSSS